MAPATSPFPARGTCSSPVAVTIVTSLSGASNPMSGREMSLSTMRSRPLRSSLSRAASDGLPVLGGEADDRLVRAAARRQRGEDVVGALERELEALGVLLELRPGDLGRAVVGHGGGHQQQVAVREALLARRRQLRGGLDVDVGDDRVAVQGHVGGDARHGGAAPGRLVGQREAHPPRGAVADVADAVDRLARAPGGHEHPEPVERARRAGRHDRLDGDQQLGRLAQAAGAPLPLRSERAGAGVQNGDPARAQDVQVGLRRRVRPHLVVHRRGDEDGAGGGEGGRGDEVVGEAVRELGDRVRRGRRDQVGVGIAHELEVRERVVLGRRLIGERAPRGVALEVATAAPARRRAPRTTPGRRSARSSPSARRGRHGRPWWPAARARAPCRRRSLP